MTTAHRMSCDQRQCLAGQYADAETGFQYLRARYYDPATGQFLTRDPIEAQTREPYGYVGGNPLNGTDPTGLNMFSDAISSAVSTVVPDCPAGHLSNGSCRGSGTVSKYADDVSRAAGVVSSACGFTAVLTSETVVGGAVFGTCAGVTRGVSLGAGALHTAVMCADLDAYCARSAASLALSYGSGQLAGAVGPTGSLTGGTDAQSLMAVARWVGQMNVEFAGHFGSFAIDTRERPRC